VIEPLVSRRIRRPHPLGNLPALLALDRRDVELALQVEPELRAVAEIAAEPHRRVGGDRAASVENVGDASGRHAEVEGEPVGAELAGGQLAFKEPAGMYDGGHGSTLMIVDDLDVVGVTLVEHEADSPPRVHCHRPLISPIAFELVKANSPQRA